MDRRRQALATTVALISNADVGVVEHAGDMLAKLPRLDSCGELGELETASEIPPQHVEAVRRLETQLVQAQVLANAGLIDAADEVVRSVATEGHLDRPASSPHASAAGGGQQPDPASA